MVGAIASNDADIRLKFLIKQLMDQSSDAKLIKLSLTREDMANFVGVTRETISRKLSQLAHDGILELVDNKQIRILDETYFS